VCTTVARMLFEVCGVALCEEIWCISGGLSSEMAYLLISRAFPAFSSSPSPLAAPLLVPAIFCCFRRGTFFSLPLLRHLSYPAVWLGRKTEESIVRHSSRKFSIEESLSENLTLCQYFRVCYLSYGTMCRCRVPQSSAWTR